PFFGDPATTEAIQWNDLNSDGWPQSSELEFYDRSRGLAHWEAQHHVDDALGHWFYAAAAIRRYPVKEWNAAPAPIYGPFPVGDESVKAPTRVQNIEGRWGAYLHRDAADGSLYGAFNSDMPDWGLSQDSFLCRWDGDGNLLWTVGEKGSLPGQIDVFRRFLGL